MISRCARAAARGAFIVYCLLLLSNGLWAQNENETVGFRANHAFESGNFGESIDILNGGLNLNVPIGPHFQVNNVLGYGVGLSYNSKVWDTTYVGKQAINYDEEVAPINQGPFGIGFSGEFGRIIKEQQILDQCVVEAVYRQCPGYTTTYTWVSPDGSQHVIHHDSFLQSETYSGPPWTRRATNDGSYALVSGPFGTSCTENGQAGDCFFKVETPDGLTYTLEKRVECATPPYNPSNTTPYVQARASNLNVCGWYTTRIEDLSTTQPNYVAITYDARVKFKHAIESVRDSAGRVINYKNCEWTENGSACLPGSTSPTYAASNPARVATYQVDVPGFSKDAPGLDPIKVGSYKFKYELTTIDLLQGNAQTPNPVLKLVQLDYPDSVPRNGSPSLPDQYSMYFDYSGFGELTCRTLPLLRTKAGSPQITGNACAGITGNWATYVYGYDYYSYSAAKLIADMAIASCATGNFCGAGTGQPILSGYTRHLTNKGVNMTQGAGISGEWQYNRLAIGTTNPPKVTVTDPFLNDTVYFYHNSANSGNPLNPGNKPEDGYAPEWNDGANYRIDYYEGSEATGRLVRTALLEQDADAYPADTSKRSKDNVRIKQQTTRHMDDGGRETTVGRNTWDSQGHWGVETLTGFEVGLPKVTRRGYQVGRTAVIYRTGNLLFEETSDGMRVLSRVDNVYDANGRLTQTLARAVPGAPGEPYTPSPLQRQGDVKTTLTYSQASGNVKQKTLSSDPAGSATYTIQYTYAPTGPAGSCTTTDECGGYLTGKKFLGAGFWSIKRDRDWNTGLIKRTYDTANVYADYNYDSLGRLTDITPQGEVPTKVDYPALTETTVTQGDSASSDYIFTRYRYDTLGRQIAQQRRPDDPTRGYPCQTTKYDVMSRVTFKSDWAYLTEANCAPGFSGETGTKYSFQESSSGPIDPFGRVRREIPSDANETTRDKVIETKYFGTSTQVRVNGVRGPNQKPFPAITTFYKDGLGRLVAVESPAGSRCSVSGTACATDANCPSGQTCMAIDGGANAFYSYDALDNLVRVDLTEGINTQTRHFGYDGLGHLLYSDNPENGTTLVTAYDAMGNPLTTQDASGTIRRLDYDFAGRVLKSYVKTPGGTEKTVSENKYDDELQGSVSLGKLTTILNYDEEGILWLTENLTYNGLGGRLSDVSHIFKEYSPPGTLDLKETTSYAYDNRGQLTSLTYPIEPTGTRTRLPVTYAYKNGVLISATSVPPPGCTSCPTTLLATLSYGPAGGIEQIKMPGGGRTWTTYDSRNRPSTITGGKYGTSSWTRKDYESGAIAYDGAGNIASMGSQHSYAYDAANRLISAIDWVGTNQYNETFSYDSFGNMARRWMSTNSAFTEIDEFDMVTPGGPKSNRVVSRATSTDSGSGLTSSTPVQFTYDAKGNVIEGGRRWRPYAQTVDTEDVLRYDYSPLNQLRRTYRVKTTTSPATVSEMNRFFYDSRGNRIAKVDLAADVKTYYVRDQSGQVLSEFQRPLGDSAAPEWQKDYLMVAGRMLGLKENLRAQPVRNLRVTTNHEPVTLAWDPSAEVDWASYKVYRKRDPQDASFVLIGSPTLTTYSDTSADYADYQVVYYRVTAVDATGYESGASAIRVSVNDDTAPTAPILLGVAGDGTVTLTWTASTGPCGVPGYQIERRASLTDAPTLLTSELISTTTYVDIGLTNNTTYYYTVKAVYVLGEPGTPCSAQAIGQPPDLPVMPTDHTPPAPPHRVRASDECEQSGATQDSIRISWDVNSDNDNVASYEIYSATDPSTLANTVPIVSGLPATATNYVHQVATQSPPATLYYALKAVDSANNKSALSEVRAVLSRDRTHVPQVRLSTKATDGQVTVSWVDLPTEGNHLVYRRLNASRSCGDYVYLGTSTVGTTVRFTDSGMPNNVAYDYAVTTMSNGVESTFSRPALGVPLDKPTQFSQCTRSRTSSSNQMYLVTDLQWDAPTVRPYQPILANNASGDLGYLKGYHLFHQQLCRVRDNGLLQDNNQIRELVTDPSNPSDPYLLRSDQLIKERAYEWEAPRFYAPDIKDVNAPDLTFSPALSPGDDLFRSSSDAACNIASSSGGSCASCMIPKNVYKIYAEGSWLTAESDWPDYFDPFGESPLERCEIPLLSALNLGPGGLVCSPSAPLCKDVALPPPSNVKATAGTGGSVTVSWDPQVPSDGSQVGGYYVYGRKYSTTQKGFVIQPPLPFITVGPAATNATISGLESSTAGLGTEGWKFNVASFDDRGRVSVAYNGRCQYTGQVCTDDEQCADDVCRYSRRVCFSTSGTPTFPCSTKGRCTAPIPQPQTVSCVVNSDCATGQTCIPDSCFPQACDDTSSRTCTLSASACVTDTDCPGFAGHCRVTTSTGCTLDSQCPGTEICVHDEVCRNTQNMAITAGVGWAQKVNVWTLNDHTGYPVSRKGIKLAWQQLSGVSGYRVYRSLSSDAPESSWCALLRQGTPQNPNPEGVTVCETGDPLAFSEQYSTGPSLVGSAPTPYYWDTKVVVDVVYYYRVTSVSTSGQQSPLSAAPVLSAKQLGYDDGVPPPPSGFKAWAPSSGPDMLGIYVSWCKDWSPDSRAADAAFSPSSYVLYRSGTSGGPYTYKVTIPLACLDEDGAGNRTNRCEIVGSPACQNGTCVYPTPTVQFGCGGKPCAIVDLTFSFPGEFPQKEGTVVQQNYFNIPYNHHYIVAVVGASGKESQPSFENVGYLNYCGTGVDCVRRDADGDGEYLVCGDRAALDGRETLVKESLSGSNELDEASHLRGIAPYRVIGLPPPPGNPYSPPARFVFYHLDHLGSVRAVLDASGNLVSTHSYLPFGEERPNLPDYSLSNRHFTGHERDKESGLDYMMARYYSSSVGRFLTVDPSRTGVSFANPQTWNRYAYTRNNPLARIDPNGLTDIYIGGAWDKRYQNVEPYARQQGGTEGRTVQYFRRGQVKQAIAYANSHLGNGEPLNIIGHSLGAKSALQVAAGVRGVVNTLVGIDPVGNGGARPENVLKVVTVNSYPSSPNISDSVKSVGVDWLGQSAAFTGQADVTIDVDTNHANFEGMYEATQCDGESASDIVSQTYNMTYGGPSAGNSGRGSFFGPDQQPGRSNNGGYVDEDGTHWSIQGANVR